MSEVIARIGAKRDIELTIDGSTVIDIKPLMTPEDAAYLAKGLLACAAALLAPNPPDAFSIIGDAQLPIHRWTTATSTITGEPVLILAIPSGVELTFQLSPKAAREMGEALVTAGEVQQYPADRSGTIH